VLPPTIPRRPDNDARWGLEGLRFGVWSLEFGVLNSVFSGLRSLAAAVRRKLNTGFTAPTERTPSSSRGSASNGPRVVATMIRGSASNGVHADLTRIAKI
jgi:hypothetical protein